MFKVCTLAVLALSEGGSLVDVNPGLIIWTVVTFVILLFILKKVAWKPILTALDKREATIKESLEKAAQTYKDVYDKYPKYERTPESLFLSAFIEANDLKNYNKATSIYKLFLEKYPDHELTPSVKAELDNMGLSPDEILKKPQPELDAKRK